MSRLVLSVSVPSELKEHITDDLNNAIKGMQEHLSNIDIGEWTSVDVVEDDLLEMGQWVFEGRAPMWIGAAVDRNGEAYLYSCDINHLFLGIEGCTTGDDAYWGHPLNTSYTKLDGKFDASDWRNSAISREPVNDVEYLDKRQDFKNEVWPDMPDHAYCIVNEADLNHIFIQNLCTTLLQRMHSLERFSTVDDRIGAADIKAWDIVFDRAIERFGVVTGVFEDTISATFLDKKCMPGATTFHANSLLGGATSTIQESQISDFCSAMEAHYAKAS